MARHAAGEEELVAVVACGAHAVDFLQARDDQLSRAPRGGSPPRRCRLAKLHGGEQVPSSLPPSWRGPRSWRRSVHARRLDQLRLDYHQAAGLGSAQPLPPVLTFPDRSRAACRGRATRRLNLCNAGGTRRRRAACRPPSRMSPSISMPIPRS